MRKTLIIALLLCLFAGIAQAQHPMLIMGGRIDFKAVTLEMSTVNGTAFITQVSGSIPFTGYLNRSITISDGTNTVTGFIKAVGTGETYGSELVTNGTMELDANWGNFGSPTTNARSSEQAHGGTYSRKFVGDSSSDGINQAVSRTSGRLYNGVAWVYISALTATSVNFNLLNANAIASETNTGAWIEKSIFGTATATDASFVAVYQAGAGAATAYVDDVSIKQVLTPDTTGVTIVSTRGGTTYNWASNSGINPNAASFTVTIGP